MISQNCTTVSSSMNASQEYAKKIHLVMDDEDDFHEFTRIVRSFKSNEILESTAIMKLSGMIKDKFEDLTLGLNHCLSDGFKIEKSVDGQLYYRSPAQEDLVPLLVDVRIQQVMAELNEAKFRLQCAKEEQQEATKTIKQQSIAIDDLNSILNDEKQKNKDSLKKLQQESHTIRQQSIAISNLRSKLKNEKLKNKDSLKTLQRDSTLALKQELRKYNDMVRRIQQETEVEKEAEIQNIKNKFDKFKEKSKNRKKQLKLLIRQLQMDNKEDENTKGIVQDLETQNKILRGQIQKHWGSASDQLNSSYQQLLAEYEILSESQIGLQLSNDEMKSELERCTGEYARKMSTIHNKVQSITSSLECPICLDPMRNTHISPECLHRFCGECFKTSLSKCSNTCPMCRLHLSSKRCLREDQDHDTLVNALHDIKNIILGADNGGNHQTMESLSLCDAIDESGESSLEENSILEEYDFIMSDGENTNPEDEDCDSEYEEDENKKRTSSANNEGQLTMCSAKSFNRKIEQLKEFKAAHGHVDVAWKHKANRSLYEWCRVVRKSFHGEGAKTIILTEEQKKSLIGLGFDFDFGRNQSSSQRTPAAVPHHWDASRQDNENDVEESDSNDKDCDSEYEEDEMRSFQKKKQVGSAKSFNRKIEQLKEFKAAHGHVNVAWKHKTNRSLYEWCRVVRKSFHGEGAKTIILTEERKKVLAGLGFDFDFGRNQSLSQRTRAALPHDQDASRQDNENDVEESAQIIAFNRRGLQKRFIIAFNKRLEELKRFKSTHGHLNVTESADKSLARWCANVRASFCARVNGTNMKILMTDERIALLEELGFDFNLTGPSSSGATAPSMSQSNINKSDEGMSPRNECVEDLFADAEPCTTNKEPFDQDLEVEDKNDLEEGLKVPAIARGRGDFHFRKRYLVAFNGRLEELKKFKAAHGHLNVTESEDKSLARWCANVRKSYHAKDRGRAMKLVRMSDERIASLEQLGFDFNPCTSTRSGDPSSKEIANTTSNDSTTYCNDGMPPGNECVEESLADDNRAGKRLLNQDQRFESMKRFKV